MYEWKVDLSQLRFLGLLGRRFLCGWGIYMVGWGVVLGAEWERVGKERLKR